MAGIQHFKEKPFADVLCLPGLSHQILLQLLRGAPAHEGRREGLGSPPAMFHLEVWWKVKASSLYFLRIGNSFQNLFEKAVLFLCFQMNSLALHFKEHFVSVTELTQNTQL